MQWPDLSAAFKQVPLPESYRYAQLRRSDVPVLRAAIAEWHPDVSVGAASCYLDQDFYETAATLAGEAELECVGVLVDPIVRPAPAHGLPFLLWHDAADHELSVWHTALHKGAPAGDASSANA